MNAYVIRPARRTRRSDIQAMQREGDGARRSYTRVPRSTQNRAALREQLG